MIIIMVIRDSVMAIGQRYEFVVFLSSVLSCV